MRRARRVRPSGVSPASYGEAPVRATRVGRRSGAGRAYAGSDVSSGGVSGTGSDTQSSVGGDTDVPACDHRWAGPGAGTGWARAIEAEEAGVVALSVILFPPLLIAFLLVMERVEEPLRRPAGPREVSEFLNTATPGEGDTLASSGIRRALSRWRRRREKRGGSSNPPMV